MPRRRENLHRTDSPTPEPATAQFYVVGGSPNTGMSVPRSCHAGGCSEVHPPLTRTGRGTSIGGV